MSTGAAVSDVKGWLGVDLDGTLAKYVSGQGVAFVGEPIVRMVDRVRAWLARGIDVRIFTARVCGASGEDDRRYQVEIIEAWCLQHLGRVLPITCVKDYSMIELWDDRAIRVERNVGSIARSDLIESVTGEES